MNFSARRSSDCAGFSLFLPDNRNHRTGGEYRETADLKKIGGRIVERRKELKLTQEQIAERMNVSIQMISNIERGNKAIKIDNLLKLCDILKTSTDYILTGKRTDNDFDHLASKISQLTEPDYKMIEMLVDYRLQDSYIRKGEG